MLVAIKLKTKKKVSREEMEDDEDLEIQLSDIEDERQDNRARHREGNLNVPTSETFAGSGIPQAEQEVEQTETQNAPPTSFHASKAVDALSKMCVKSRVNQSKALVLL